MSRNYQNALRGQGVLVPRWLVICLVGGLMLWGGLRIAIPPHWVVQRLDAPDGSRSALLLRTRYLDDAFKVRVREGRLWKTMYFSSPITNDYRVDLHERLSWSEDSRELSFSMKGEVVWGHEFEGPDTP